MIPTGTKFGRYQIHSQLGAGGMGEVYLAQDTKLDRKVALKILPAEVAANDERMRRFIQEAKAAAALNHPNIAHVYEIDEVDGLHFIAMEFIDGETLREHMKRGRMTVGEALDAAIQIASALAAAHEAGIIHRDIKPENIMIRRRDAYVKVLDFGVAKLTESPAISSNTEASTLFKTAEGMVFGTILYMSPEQARGSETDARTDIWSLGVVLYEIVAGCLPFEGSTTSDGLAAILSEKEPPPLARFAREVPAELERIVEKALRKEREERYQTVKDMMLDLKSLKHRLEFEAELQRSKSPEASSSTTGTENSNQMTAAGAVAPVTLGGEAAQTAPVTESLASRIKHHRRSLMIALALLVVAAAGLAYLFYSARLASAIDSIAVLPLVNASSDPNTEYLSDGISEALINSLTELQQLRVIARSTAFRYKGREVDPLAVGRELNVRAVLMGRVRQVADTLNIQVDLVDASTGAQLWGKEYERRISDVLSIKQTIAREVTDKLRLRLSGDDQQRLAKRDTTNAEAYQFYLRGRYYWNKRSPEGIRKAIEQFQQAIDRDPNHALGYVGLADCYLSQEQYAGVPASETLPKAKAAVDRALQIDDSLAEVHTSLAEIYQRQWRWAEAEQEFRRAITLNPNYPTAHAWFTMHLRIKRQFDEALRESKRAQELDPLSPILSVASIYLLKNDINSAIEQNKRGIEFDPSFPQAHRWLGLAYLKQRRYEEAIAELQKGVELSGKAGHFLGDLGYCYAVMGKQDEALQILRELEERYARRESIGMHIAQVYAGLGDKDQVFAWLEKDFKMRSGVLPYITWWVNFDDLRSDPRYADLVRRMGLTP